MPGLFLYNDARLLMLRARRRVFLSRVMVGVGLSGFVAACAFLAGLCGVGL